MSLISRLMKKTEKIDFLFPKTFEDLMNEEYYDYDKFEWFLYYAFQLDGVRVQKVGRKGRGDGGADLILSIDLENGGVNRIGIQAKYWKNRVGTEPINQLASAKSRHGLQDLWLITTSDLTPDAKEIAESMDIKILRKEDVINIINDIKNKHAEQIEKDGESQIEFLEPKRHLKKKKETKTPKPQVETKKYNEDEEKIRKLRIDLAKKHNIQPIYFVFGNDTLRELASKKPKTLTGLSKISGIGQVKLDQFGKEIIEFIKKEFTEKSKYDKELYKLLLKERPKIAKYNKLKEEEVYTNRVAKNIAIMKPKTKEDLNKIFGFNKDNINIFGDYLIRVINR